jgi:hypothetical protein
MTQYVHVRPEDVMRVAKALADFKSEVASATAKMQRARRGRLA